MSTRGIPCGADEASSDAERLRVRWRVYRSFAATTSSVPGARRWMRDVLVRAGVEPEAQARAELMISELVTNAIQHTRGVKVLVSVEPDDHLEAAVKDDDATSLRPRQADLWEAGGRGLALVDALADEWGTRPAGDEPGAGKWVWFRLRRPPH